MPLLEIKFTPQWREESGDGSACLHCDAPAWLRLRRLVMQFQDAGKSACVETPIVLCGSCADALEDSL